MDGFNTSFFKLIINTEWSIFWKKSKNKQIKKQQHKLQWFVICVKGSNKSPREIWTQYKKVPWASSLGFKVWIFQCLSEHTEDFIVSEHWSSLHPTVFSYISKEYHCRRSTSLSNNILKLMASLYAKDFPFIRSLKKVSSWEKVAKLWYCIYRTVHILEMCTIRKWSRNHKKNYCYHYFTCWRIERVHICKDLSNNGGIFFYLLDTYFEDLRSSAVMFVAIVLIDGKFQTHCYYILIEEFE